MSQRSVQQVFGKSVTDEVFHRRFEKKPVAALLEIRSQIYILVAQIGTASVPLERPSPNWLPDRSRKPITTLRAKEMKP